MLRQRLETIFLRLVPNIRTDVDFLQQLDSLQIVALLDEIEREFDISFPTSQLFILTQQFSLENLERALLEHQVQTTTSP